MSEKKMKVQVYSGKGARAKAMDIDSEAFGSRVNFGTLKEVIGVFEAGRRSGTAATKERSEITGTTKKPWRQKGTGYARAGSKKSPIWRSGGTVFGPHPRSYSKKVPKKKRQEALRNALLLKLQQGQIKIVQELKMAEPKTKNLGDLLEKIGAQGSALVVVSEFDKNLWLSARNLPAVAMVMVDRLDARKVASCANVVVSADAMAVLAGSEKK